MNMNYILLHFNNRPVRLIPMFLAHIKTFGNARVGESDGNQYRRKIDPITVSVQPARGSESVSVWRRMKELRRLCRRLTKWPSPEDSVAR